MSWWAKQTSAAHMRITKADTPTQVAMCASRRRLGGSPLGRLEKLGAMAICFIQRTGEQEADVFTGRRVGYARRSIQVPPATAWNRPGGRGTDRELAVGATGTLLSVPASSSDALRYLTEGCSWGEGT